MKYIYRVIYTSENNEFIIGTEVRTEESVLEFAKKNKNVIIFEKMNSFDELSIQHGDK